MQYLGAIITAVGTAIGILITGYNAFGKNKRDNFDQISDNYQDQIDSLRSDIKRKDKEIRDYRKRIDILVDEINKLKDGKDGQ